MLQRLRRIFTISCAIGEVIALCVPLLFLNDCASRRIRIDVNITENANDRNPVALDFVTVGNKDLEKEISKLTAAQWFQKRQQYLLDYPKTSELSVISGEWVPGQRVPVQELPSPSALPVPIKIPVPLLSSSAPTLVFANYFSPGPHRATLVLKKSTRIELGDDDLKVITGGK